MTIITSELKLFPSSAISETGSNGGRMATTEIISGVRHAAFPLVTAAQRASGLTTYRKLFYANRNADNIALANANLCLSGNAPGDDRVLIHVGTQRETQTDFIAAGRRAYGAGKPTAAISNGATAITVNLETGAGTAQPIRAGDTLRIADATHNELVEVSTVGYSTDQVAITLVAGTVYSYATADSTVVASCIGCATIGTSWDAWVEDSITGTYNESGHPLTLYNLGTIEQTWTLTMSSGTAFSVIGDTVGSIGTGVTGSNFSPINPATGIAYFTLQASGWNGTWAANDTIIFETHPAALPFWAVRTVPAGSAAYAADGCAFTLLGESA